MMSVVKRVTNPNKASEETSKNTAALATAPTPDSALVDLEQVRLEIHKLYGSALDRRGQNRICASDKTRELVDRELIQTRAFLLVDPQPRATVMALVKGLLTEGVGRQLAPEDLLFWRCIEIYAADYLLRHLQHLLATADESIYPELKEPLKTYLIEILQAGDRWALRQLFEVDTVYLKQQLSSADLGGSDIAAACRSFVLKVAAREGLGDSLAAALELPPFKMHAKELAADSSLRDKLRERFIEQLRSKREAVPRALLDWIGRDSFLQSEQVFTAALDGLQKLLSEGRSLAGAAAVALLKDWPWRQSRCQDIQEAFLAGLADQVRYLPISSAQGESPHDQLTNATWNFPEFKKGELLKHPQGPVVLRRLCELLLEDELLVRPLDFLRGFKQSERKHLLNQELRDHISVFLQGALRRADDQGGEPLGRQQVQGLLERALELAQTAELPAALQRQIEQKLAAQRFSNRLKKFFRLLWPATAAVSQEA